LDDRMGIQPINNCATCPHRVFSASKEENWERTGCPRFV